ncbi:MAG: hypothetical protein CMH49_06840 [Myxococcales bacterium]|nr:hypothetical protein [Myxococcales bacterium]
MISTSESLRCKQIIQELKDEIETKVFGKGHQVEFALLAAITQGHLLIEDVPGVGKTTLARTLAQGLGGSFQRVQCTADLLPSDLTGVNIYHPGEQRFSFQKGPLFTHVLLADELNRATPKAQSSLLEAMEEGQVTLDRNSHQLPYPFWVVATQNPESFAGTFQLPESQLDRFALSIKLGYLEASDERQVLSKNAHQSPQLKRQAHQQQESLKTHQQRLENWQQLIENRHQVDISPELLDYMIEFAQHTRSNTDLKLGVSTRAVQSWVKLCQARALMFGRQFVIPEDISILTVPALAHRIWFYRGSQQRSNRITYLETVAQSLILPR